MSTDSTDPDLTDETLEEAIRGLVSHFHDLLRERLDVADTALLKAHFLIEERLNKLLTDLALQPNRVKLDIEFYVKVKALRAFAPLGDDVRWELVEGIGTLRNGIAHPEDPEKKQRALRQLRELWKRELGKDESLHDWGDYNVILGATMHSIAFLSAVGTEIEKAGLGNAAKVRAKERKA